MRQMLTLVLAQEVSLSGTLDSSQDSKVSEEDSER